MSQQHSREAALINRGAADRVRRSKQRWSGGAPEQRRAHVRYGVRAFMATPRKQQVDDRESSGVQGESRRIRVGQMAETEIAGSKRDAAFVDHELRANGQLPDRML